LAPVWADFLLRDGKSKQTTRNCASHVSAPFDNLIQKGFLQENPVISLMKIKTCEKRVRRKEGHGWQPFGLETLRRIYTPENFKKTLTEHVRSGRSSGSTPESE